MKRFMIASVATLFIALPLYANSPDSSATSTTTTEATETTYPAAGPSNEIQKMEETKKVESDVQLQQAPSEYGPTKPTETTTTTEEVTE